MGRKIDISVDTSVNESIISNLSGKQADLRKKVNDEAGNSDMCGRVVKKVSGAFDELNNIKTEINNLNDALIEFLSDANDNIIEADNSIACWINDKVQ